MSITINFLENQPTWVQYEGEIEVSKKDYKKFQNGEIELRDLIHKYEVEYGGEGEILDPIDGVKWEYEEL